MRDSGAETFLTALHDEKLFNYILLKRLSQGKNHKFWNLQKLFHKSFVCVNVSLETADVIQTYPHILTNQ